MLVTITTDASFCPDNKVGGFAFWITSNINRVQVSGGFKDTIENSADAEFMCILNSLVTLIRLNYPIITKVIVNTDCEAVIKQVKQNKTSKLVAYYKALIKKNKLTIEFRHVKAHTSKNDKRSYVNRWCDKEAKKEMLKKRKEILSNQK